MKRSGIKRGPGFRSRDREPAELPSIPRELPEMGNPISIRPPREGVDFIEESSLKANFGHHHVKPLVRGIYGPAALKAAPKTLEHRNPDLLALARGQKCLLHVLGICSCDAATVVACHSNLSVHGKAGARKADDHYSVWGCSACHRWLDQGSASYEVKRAYFMAAYAKQLIEWAKIAYDMSETPKARRAAEWALLQLPTKESNP